jgi:DNA-binding CsgD family transcriptional regulator
MDSDRKLADLERGEPHARNDREWYLLSSHGIVYFYIAAHPDCTVKQIGEDLFLSRRTVWGLVGDLKRAEMIAIRREGRRHRYTVRMDTKLHHPAFADNTMRQMIRRLFADELDSH